MFTEKSKPSTTSVVSFRMRSQEERRKINSPYIESPRIKQQVSPPRAPTTPPPTSKAFSRNSRTSSPYRGRRARSPSPVMSSFGIGPSTAIKRAGSAGSNLRNTRMAFSRSNPNSPRSTVGRNDSHSDIAKSLEAPHAPTVLQWTSRSGKKVYHQVGLSETHKHHPHHEHQYHDDDSPGFVSPTRSPMRIGGGKGTFVTQPQRQAHKSGDANTASSMSSVHAKGTPGKRPKQRQWREFEFSDTDDSDQSEGGQAFPGLQGT